MSRNLPLILLLIYVLLDLSIIAFRLGHEWRFATKTLLVPILIAYYIMNARHVNKLFVAGLAMSFLGDLFLLFSGGFIAGLSSFLLAHILYIWVFKKKTQQFNLAIIPVILIFIASLFFFLYPHLGTLKIPVFVYALTIGIMLFYALGTRQNWLIIGAILFVISDSILSINMFYSHSTIGSLAVMTTYVIAQLCLVKGMINQN